MSDTLTSKPKVTYKLSRDPDTGVENITVFSQGQVFPASSDSHANFDAIVEAARAQDENVVNMFDIALTAGLKFEDLDDSGRVTYTPGHLFLDGNEMNNGLAQHIVALVREKQDFQPSVNFLAKMAQNPNPESVEHLYKFIEVNMESEHGAFTITPDGDFIAYKGVESDGKGGYQSTWDGGSASAIVDGVVVDGKVPNAVGSVVKMRRDDVVHDPSVHCSTGLHVGTFAYATTYGSRGAMLKVKVNPRDVVSVPNDSREKMRVARYEVLEIIKAPETKAVVSAKVKDEKSVIEQDSIRPGDVFQDTDPRRADRKIRVKEVNTDDGVATVTSESKLGLRKRKIALNRLASRKYKRVKRGKKS